MTHHQETRMDSSDVLAHQVGEMAGRALRYELEIKQFRAQRDTLSGMLRGMARRARRYDQIGEHIARKADEEVAELRAQRAAALDLADEWDAQYGDTNVSRRLREALGVEA